MTMAEAQPTSHMAIFVLMAILLTAVTTTATPHHSPHHVAEGRHVPDNATVDRVSRWRSAAESHDGGHDGHVTEEDSGRPPLKEGRALGDIHKRDCVMVGIEIGTSTVYWSGTDGNVCVQLIAPDGTRSGFHNIDDPNADDFERGSVKTFWFCAKYVGETINRLGLKLLKSGYCPDWRLTWMKVLYRSNCYVFNWFGWINKFNHVYTLYKSTSCVW